MYVAPAATCLQEVVRDIEPDQLGTPTPCPDYDVRGLINHLLFWGPSLEGAARKETVPPPAESEHDLGLTAADLLAQLDRTAKAWSEPGAWNGVTHMGGPTELPAALVGGMIATEFIVHGWDLATATGQSITPPDDLLDYLLDEVGKTAEQARQMGVYGPEVAVPATAPKLSRLLGLTGRDPGWTANGG
ncbi:TIGR03086 family protein [Amycolatopsis sp. K13G38]|uniref:TIGR03086 family protein n=1 Tax=Amycolatopsis acididurans TaxID=2724524 RepID=A0ABX1JGB9_9PSEU|nr:TIGR03086 family metal-binding protein [Amycolatopsis acididurans]NKQ58842.1 TIGR03086 family protein [Amycolatopsis acididurans]